MPAQASALARFSGRITDRPEVRVRPAGPDGRDVPVLCLHLVADGALGAPLHVEQPFQPGALAACEAAARRYHPGQRVIVLAPLHAARLVLSAAAHIHPEEATP